MRDTIKMAREAWEQSGEGWVHPDWFEDRAKAFKAFESLVIEAERNRLATECAMLPFGDTAASFAVWIKNGGKA
jgi:hypothetical protein